MPAQNAYDVSWTGLDSGGREGLWEPSKWIKVLRIIAEHEGESVYDENSQVYETLEQVFPEDAWRSTGNNGDFRPLFRDYSAPWTKTGVVSLGGGVFRIERRGREILSGRLDPSEVLIDCLRDHSEDSERPFAVLASAFLEAPEKEFALEEIYWGVQQNFRPSIDGLTEALERGGENSEPVPSTRARRLKGMLKLLVAVNALTSVPSGNWLAYGRKTLKAVAGPGELPAVTAPTSPYQRERFSLLVEAFELELAATRLEYDSSLIRRFICSLCAKRFVILTGLSGSGKTNLAVQFAKWLCAERSQYAVVAVGANWTTNKNIVGYPDAFDSERFHRTAALALMLSAHRNPASPHFLILDEMNLSHVERYFADFLSAIESPGEPLALHSGVEDIDGVPPRLPQLPPNVFVIGTVNVDETTYMFSPKVLDRANVIEFRVSADSISNYLNASGESGSELCGASGAQFAAELVAAQMVTDAQIFQMHPVLLERLKTEIQLLFEVLAVNQREFGFRTVREMLRFSFFMEDLMEENGASVAEVVLDAQVYQKVLPRLYGGRKKLEPVLLRLLAYTTLPRQWNDGALENREEIIGSISDVSVDEGRLMGFVSDGRACFQLSAEKLVSMLARVRSDNFVAFAEA